MSTLSPPFATPSPAAAARESPILFVSLQVFLVILALSRYDATSWVFRGTTEVDVFNWFWRFRWLGVFSFFDFFLAWLVGLALLKSFGGRRRWGPDGFLWLLPLLVSMAAAAGIANRVSETTTQDILFQLRNYLYLIGSYFVAVRIQWTEDRLAGLVRLMLFGALSAIVLVRVEDLYLPAESRVWKYGRFAALRDVADFAFIVFVLVFLAALVLEGRPRHLIRRVGVSGIIVYLIWTVATGVGKGPLFVVAACLGYLAVFYRLWGKRWFAVLSLLAISGFAALTVWLIVARPRVEPGSPLYVYTTFQADDASVSTRRAEVRNLAENLTRRGGWLWGIGLGARWFEYTDQPPDLGAFPEHEQGILWHLGMHFPLARVALDFGVLGMGLLLVILAVRLSRSWRLLRRADLTATTRAFLHGAWMTIGFELIVNSFSAPKGVLLAGVLLGVVTALQRLGHSLASCARGRA